jgi:hypothetical protein
MLRVLTTVTGLAPGPDAPRTRTRPTTPARILRPVPATPRPPDPEALPARTQPTTPATTQAPAPPLATGASPVTPRPDAAGPPDTGAPRAGAHRAPTTADTAWHPDTRAQRARGRPTPPAPDTTWLMDTGARRPAWLAVRASRAGAPTRSPAAVRSRRGQGHRPRRARPAPGLVTLAPAHPRPACLATPRLLSRADVSRALEPPPGQTLAWPRPVLAVQALAWPTTRRATGPRPHHVRPGRERVPSGLGPGRPPPGRTPVTASRRGLLVRPAQSHRPGSTGLMPPGTGQRIPPKPRRSCQHRVGPPPAVLQARPGFLASRAASR